MSILSPRIEKLQAELRGVADPALKQMVDALDPSDPKKLFVGMEIANRLKQRNAAKAQQSAPPTVAEGLGAAIAPKPPMPPMPQGMPPGMPPQGVASLPPGMGAMPQMPPQGMPPMPPQMPPQAPPQMQAGGHVHDYGVASLPYVPRYEHGGVVAFSGKEKSDVQGDGEEQRSWITDFIENNANNPEAAAKAERLAAIREQSENSEIPNPNAEYFGPWITDVRSGPPEVNTGPKPLGPDPYDIPLTATEFKEQYKDSPWRGNWGNADQTPHSLPSRFAGMSAQEMKDAANSVDPMAKLESLKSEILGMDSGPGIPSFAPRERELKNNLKAYETGMAKYAPHVDTFADMAAKRKLAEAAVPGFDPNFYENRDKRLQQQYDEQRKNQKFAAIGNLASALSAAGAEGSFGRGLAAFGKNINESNAKFFKDVEDARNHFLERQDTNKAAQQAANEGRVADYVKLSEDQEKEDRAFHTNLVNKAFETANGISIAKAQYQMDSAKFARELATARQNVALKLGLASISLSQHQQAAQEKLELYKIVHGNKGGKSVPAKDISNLIFKYQPIAEQTAQDEVTRAGKNWAKDYTEAQRQEMVANSLRRLLTENVNMANQMGLSPMDEASFGGGAASGNTITGLTLDDE